MLSSGQSPNSSAWHIKSSITWPSTTPQPVPCQSLVSLQPHGTLLPWACHALSLVCVFAQTGSLYPVLLMPTWTSTHPSKAQVSCKRGILGPAWNESSVSVSDCSLLRWTLWVVGDKNSIRDEHLSEKSRSIWYQVWLDPRVKTITSRICSGSL